MSQYDTGSVTPSGTNPSGTTGQDKAHGAADQAKDKAQGVADQAKDKAQGVAEQAKSAASDQVDSRSTQLGDTVGDKASEVRSLGDSMHEQGNDTVAKVVDQVATYTEQIADYLRNADGGSLTSDLERMARKQPWAVSLGGLALGFAASRVIRASSDRRHEQDMDGAGQSPSSTGTGYPETPSYLDLDGPSAGRAGTTPPLARPEDPLTAPLGGNSVIDR